MPHFANTEITVTTVADLPAPRDSEMLVLLRAFLTPILETARDWGDLSDRLSARGFRVAFHNGRLVFVNDAGNAVCTGRDLGVPLRDLTSRIGEPNIRIDERRTNDTLH